MSESSSEKEFLERFSDRYQKVLSPVSLDIEEESLGTRVGASSWSTPDQVEVMAKASRLKADSRLLDIGSGAGWPGSRIGDLTGAEVTLSDITEEALRVALTLDSSAKPVLADASSLPFANGSFDAITHSDVLCCVPRKAETLEECRRVLTPNGVMVFTVLATAPGLGEDELASLVRTGNDFLFSDLSYPQLLEGAGFNFEIEDVTDEFCRVADRLHRARSMRVDQLIGLWGIEEAQLMVDRAAFNRDDAAAGLLLRHYVVATVGP